MQNSFSGNRANNPVTNFFSKIFKSNKTNNSNTGGIVGGIVPTIIWSIVYLVLAVIITYVTVMTIKYLTTKCFDKKPYLKYLFRFCYSDVCLTPEQRVVNNIKIMPTKVIMKEPPQEPHSRPMSPAVKFNIKDLEPPKQVFHIGNQDFTYEQAKCKCESYNARLASYTDMVEAYNKGAEWCSYGWSEGQAAYYPTQKCTWEKMDAEERDVCGKPGINGGFFADPNLKFGVNCFGKKPEGKVVKLEDKECPGGICERPENKFAFKRADTDQIVPFNKDNWSA